MYGNGNIGKIEVKYSWVTKRNSGGGPSEGSGSSGSPGEGLPQELVLSRSDAVYYYVHDYLGSIAATLDNRGEFVFAEQVYPYGEVKHKYEAGTATQQRFDFTGKERDSETGLHYYGARYYDSKLGIWLSVDPLLDKYPGLSPYNYCLNNPINAVDPDGRDINMIFRKPVFPDQGHIIMRVVDNKANQVLATWSFGPENAAASLFCGNVPGAQTSNVEEYLSENEKLLESTTIQTDKETDLALANGIKERIKLDEKYNLIFNNCGQTAIQLINNNTKIKINNKSKLPASVMNDFKNAKKEEEKKKEEKKKLDERKKTQEKKKNLKNDTNRGVTN